jgi:hypothetical protein
MEPPEIHGATAHRAPRACTLEVPRLHAPCAKLVPAAQLDKGSRLAIAHGTLAFTRHFVVASYYGPRL